MTQQLTVLIAPDSFKGSLTAQEAARAIERGVLAAAPRAQCRIVPMADGGEGTVQSLVDATGGKLITAPAHDPLGRAINATYGMLGNGTTAVIEMAAASGIQYVDDATKNPLITSTYGTGELIRHALDQGARDFIIGLGGSATNDGGAGMAQALGAQLLDAQGAELARGGAALAQLARIDVSALDPRLTSARIRLASDVTNPLIGAQGASAVFGPQKGATPAKVKQLDAALAHYASIIKAQLHRDVALTPGAGAAGGLGAGFLAFTNASMHPGVSMVIDATHLREYAASADICFTGEGAIDAQTQYGKTPIGVAQAVKAAQPHCMVVALGGQIGEGVSALYEHGIDAIFGILSSVGSLDDAIAHASDNLARASENVMRLYLAAR